MVDLSEFVGSNPERARLVKKREKEREKLDKMEVKMRPILADIEMYNKMIAALDEREAQATLEQDNTENSEDFTE